MKTRFSVAAVLLGASLGLAAQTPQPPPMQSILAGKKLTPPVRGQAEVDFTQPKTTRKGNEVVTQLQVKNTMTAPIARLRVIETWFSGDGATIPGGEGVINGLLQPGEVQTVEIRTPFNDKMKSNSWNFIHANGTVKPHKVTKLDAPAEPAAKPATKKK
jgi:hypothetical protein